MVCDSNNPETFGSSTGIGAGPFKLVEWVKGDTVTLGKNPDYINYGRPFDNGRDLLAMSEAEITGLRGKRIPRPNPEDNWITQDVPAPRIDEDDLVEGGQHLDRRYAAIFLKRGGNLLYRTHPQTFLQTR